MSPRSSLTATHATATFPAPGGCILLPGLGREAEGTHSPEQSCFRPSSPPKSPAGPAAERYVLTPSHARGSARGQSAMGLGAPRSAVLRSHQRCKPSPRQHRHPSPRPGTTAITQPHLLHPSHPCPQPGNSQTCSHPQAPPAPHTLSLVASLLCPKAPQFFCPPPPPPSFFVAAFLPGSGKGGSFLHPSGSEAPVATGALAPELQGAPRGEVSGSKGFSSRRLPDRSGSSSRRPLAATNALSACSSPAKSFTPALLRLTPHCSRPHRRLGPRAPGLAAGSRLDGVRTPLGQIQPCRNGWREWDAVCLCRDTPP